MYEISVDIERNLMVIKGVDSLTDHELKTATDLIISEIGKLKKGYTLINDISIMNPASAYGVKEFKRGQSYIQKDVGLVIRVIKNQITGRQINNLVGNVPYKVVEVSSIEEAYKLLEG